MGNLGVAEQTTQLHLYSWEDGQDLYNHTQLSYNWNTIDAQLLKKNWGTAGDEANQIRFYGTASLGTAVITIRTGTADTYDRANILPDGKINWGSGSAASDANLYRQGVGTIATDSALSVQSGTVSLLSGSVTLVASNSPTNQVTSNGLFALSRPTNGTALTIKDSTNPVPTFGVRTDGKLLWGDGTSSFDASIYRSGAGTLTIDANKVVLTGSINLGAPSSTGWSVSNVSAGVKSYNAGSVTLTQLSNVVGNLIGALTDYGILGA